MDHVVVLQHLMIEPRLDKLPQELIDQIASETVVRFDQEEASSGPDKLADLANLSRTCKRLYDACAPTLYRQVTLEWMDTRVLCFLQALSNKPYLGSYVRVFKACGWVGWGRNSADDKVAEEILISDPVARLLYQDDKSIQWNAIIVLIMKLQPNLVALTISAAVMQLVSRWPEDQRLHGSSLAALKIFPSSNDLCSYNLCEDMFEWKQAFRPGTTPAALHSLYMDHDCRASSRLQGTHNHRQLDLESRQIAASLRHLHLFSWLRSSDRGYDCVARLIGTLDKCTSLTHLTFEDDDASLKATIDVISSSKVLTAHLQRLELRWTWAEDAVIDAATLSNLSRFIHVTSLTLPWIMVEVDTLLESTIWPPSIESLTVSHIPESLLLAAAPQTMIKARHLPASIRNITLTWVMRGNDIPLLHLVLDLINFARALDQEFASSGIVLLHKHSLDNYLQYSSPMFTSTNIERDLLLPVLREYVGDQVLDLTQEDQLYIHTILNAPSSL